MLKGFREFILRGNVIDLAVAVVIGAAFTAVVNSIVNEPVQPADRRVLQGERRLDNALIVDDRQRLADQVRRGARRDHQLPDRRGRRLLRLRLPDQPARRSARAPPQAGCRGAGRARSPSSISSPRSATCSQAQQSPPHGGRQARRRRCPSRSPVRRTSRLRRCVRSAPHRAPGHAAGRDVARSRASSGRAAGAALSVSSRRQPGVAGVPGCVASADARRGCRSSVRGAPRGAATPSRARRRCTGARVQRRSAASATVTVRPAVGSVIGAVSASGSASPMSVGDARRRPHPGRRTARSCARGGSASRGGAARRGAAAATRAGCPVDDVASVSTTTARPSCEATSASLPR